MITSDSAAVTILIVTANESWARMLKDEIKNWMPTPYVAVARTDTDLAEQSHDTTISAIISDNTIVTESDGGQTVHKADVYMYALRRHIPCALFRGCYDATQGAASGIVRDAMLQIRNRRLRLLAQPLVRQ